MENGNSKINNGFSNSIEEDGKPATESLEDNFEVEIQEKDEENPESKKKKKEKKINIFQLYKYATPIEFLMIFFGICSALIQGAALQGPYVLMSTTIDQYSAFLNCSNATTSGPLYENCTHLVNEAAIRVSVGIGICAAIIVVFYYLHVLLFTLVADKLTRRVRSMAFANILRQDIGYFDCHFGGELNTRLTQDVTKYEIGIGNKVSMMISWLSAFVTGLVICLVKGWKLTLIMCALLPIAALVSAITTRLMKIYTEKEMTAYANAGGVAEEALTNIRVVTAFGGQKKEHLRYTSLLRQAKMISIKSGLASAFGQGIPWVLTFTVAGVTIYITGLQVNKGEINPGFMFTLLGCMMQGLRALGFAAALLENIFDSQGAAYGIYEIIRAESKIDSTDKGGIIPKSMDGKIEFKNVFFSYPARSEVKVLKGLTLTIEDGQNIALVGPSGCGKSTVIQILQRFYNPEDGIVLLDGNNIQDINIEWLRKQIGVVSQDPVLFAMTVEENIRFGNAKATLEDIKRAAVEADAHDFIMKLPQGYETEINEQGTQLSRGEKQRISLARALIRQPRILLLDECTSSLDNESEATVQAALDKASKGRTTITIAHRLSTVRDCDVLFVIDKGQVEEYGNHNQLLKKEGLYHKLVSTQVKDDDFEEKPEDAGAAKGRLSITSVKSFSSLDNDNKTRIEFKTKHPLRQIFSYNKNQWPLLLIGVIGGLLLGATWPVFSILLSSVLGTIVTSNTNVMSGVQSSAFGIIGLGASAAVVAIISIYVLRYFGESLTLIIRSEAYKSILKQEISWFDYQENQVGSLTSRLADEASRVKLATGNTLLYMASALSSVILSVFIALYSSWQLGLAVLPLMPLTIAAGIIQGYMNTTYEKKSLARTQASGRLASEAIDKIRTIASLTKEQYFLDSYMSHFELMKREAYKRANIIGMAQSFVWFCSCSIEIVSVGFGMYLVGLNTIQFEVVFRILTVAVVMAAEVGRANANLPELSSSYSAAQKLLQLIQRKSLIDPSDKSGEKPKTSVGELKFDNVNFSYPTRPDVKITHSLSFEAKRGQNIAIVGPSGSGKSSIVQLIERFYDVTNGSLMMDGVELKNLNLEWLRKQMAIVFQEPILFGVSIRDNIAYGRNEDDDIPMEEIIQAAMQANIHDFISKLPKGYETNIGSKGTQLSGGQKQRLSIARALLRNPKILLLDDATSALDSYSEAIVEEALQKARSGRTSIIIAHRLSSIVNADVILYVRKGRVLERGTHVELLQKKGYYNDLYQANLRNH